MKERYYVGESSGFVYDDSNHWEHEYSVYDRLYCDQPVGTFIARGRGKNANWLPVNEARAEKRARRMCDALNRRERGVAYDPQALEPNHGSYPLRWQR